MKNDLREVFKTKEVIVATRINSTWPLITEIVGGSGIYDYVEFLAEYSPFDHYDFENISRAAELHNLGTIIKIDYYNRDYTIQKAVASGFQGVLLTDHCTAKDVEETIKMIRPASLKHGGKLGYVNRRWIRNQEFSSQSEYADLVSQLVVGVMIEKKAAFENIREICSVEGVDFVQFGPADFSMNSGLNSKVDVEKIKEVEKEIIKVALECNVSPRCEIKKASDAEYYINLGVRHFALGSELRILKDFWKNEGTDLLNKFSSK
jgi:2-keto-3-deoxy-L-rhamnonate aldolase RhmA